jgi:hypothetical protein
MCKRDGMGPHGQGRGQGRGRDALLAPEQGVGCGGGRGQGRGRQCCADQGTAGELKGNDKQQCIERVQLRIESLQTRLAQLTS